MDARDRNNRRALPRSAAPPMTHHIQTETQGAVAILRLARPARGNAVFQVNVEFGTGPVEHRTQNKLANVGGPVAHVLAMSVARWCAYLSVKPIPIED